jgi:hypothetical protein
MKTSILAAVITSAVLCAQGAYADETHHPDKKDAPAISAPAKDTKATAGKEMPLPQMQENMMKMHDLMHKIHDTKDPKEREKLMQEHMQMMQEHMKMMRDMMGGGMGDMMGGSAKGGMMGK